MDSLLFNLILPLLMLYPSGYPSLLFLSVGEALRNAPFYRTVDVQLIKFA